MNSASSRESWRRIRRSVSSRVKGGSLRLRAAILLIRNNVEDSHTRTGLNDVFGSSIFVCARFPIVSVTQSRPGVTGRVIRLRNHPGPECPVSEPANVWSRHILRKLLPAVRRRGRSAGQRSADIGVSRRSKNLSFRYGHYHEISELVIRG